MNDSPFAAICSALFNNNALIYTDLNFKQETAEDGKAGLSAI